MAGADARRGIVESAAGPEAPYTMLESVSLAFMANGQPAFVFYQRVEAHTFEPCGLMVLALAGDQIAEFTCFLDPRLPVVFNQPLTIEDAAA